jgi:hypothetical protein
VSFYIGIDNGKDGALVVLSLSGQIVEKHKTPLFKASIKGGKKQGRDEYNIRAMRELLFQYKNNSLVCIEKAQAMPAAMGGSAANYQRGLSFGLWQGILVGLEIPYEVSTPQAWMKIMLAGINVEDTKQASVIAAQRLWPKEDWRRSERAKIADNGMTDAALIGEFGRRIRNGT